MLFAAESGHSPASIVRYEVGEDSLRATSTGTGDGYWYGGGNMAITDDSRYIFFGGRKFRTDDLGVVLGTVEDGILATNATGTVAVGRRHIWDGMTFTTLAALPAEATLAAMVDDGRQAYVYVDGTERLVEVDLAE